jgi:orotidine-5'-phosphate decarboxylase
MSPTNYNKSYGERAMKFTNPTAKSILETMERKKSNLAVSVDVTRTNDLLAIIDVVSPYVCLIKVRNHSLFEYLLWHSQFCFLF